MATTGTHDIEPLAATAEGQTEEQRSAIVQSLPSAGLPHADSPPGRFGWTDRINTPAVVDGAMMGVKWPVDAGSIPRKQWSAPIPPGRAAGR